MQKAALGARSPSPAKEPLKMGVGLRPPRRLEPRVKGKSRVIIVTMAAQTSARQNEEINDVESIVSGM